MALFVHKLDQDKLQLDRSWLSYLEHLGLSVAGDNTVQHPKKAHYTVISIYVWQILQKCITYKQVINIYIFKACNYIIFKFIGLDLCINNN